MNEDTVKLSSVAELTTRAGINLIGLSALDLTRDDHYLVYRITNTNNGHYYIGQHHTHNPFDDYMGSGSYIQNAVSKYGVSSFIKEILFDFDNFSEMNEKELELVPLSSCYPMNLMSYNLRAGGNGPTNLNGENNPMFGRNDQCHGIIKWSKDRIGISNVEVFGETKAREISAAISKVFKGKPKTAEHRAKISASHIGINVLESMTHDEIELWKIHVGNGNKGKTLSDAQKLLIGQANAGRIRMVHPILLIEKRVKSDKCQELISQGFTYGYIKLGKIKFTAAPNIL